MTSLPTILHVEDDENDVFLVARAFRKAEVPCTIHHVPDGQQAIDYLSGLEAGLRPPKAMLLDLKLPGLNGFEVLAWTRAQPQFLELPVFVLSSSDQPQDMTRARELGANRYFVKTAGFAEVIEAAKELVQSEIADLEPRRIEPAQLPLGLGNAK